VKAGVAVTAAAAAGGAVVVGATVVVVVGATIGIDCHAGRLLCPPAALLVRRVWPVPSAFIAQMLPHSQKFNSLV